jgi:hypothetical protein
MTVHSRTPVLVGVGVSDQRSPMGVKTHFQSELDTTASIGRGGNAA